jgi:hypothetical protein
MNQQLLDIAIQETPQAIALLKALFHRAQPQEPLPTDTEVLEAYYEALINSLAKDSAWLAAHQPTTP